MILICLLGLKKEGYAVNQPIEFDEAIVRFVNGEEQAIVHKTTG